MKKLKTSESAGRLPRKLHQWRKLIQVAGWWTVARVYGAKIIGRARPISVKIAGHRLWLRPLSPDLGVACAAFGGEFQPLRQHCRKKFDGLIIDAGGYIGTAALALADLYPRAHIVTVEPEPENFAMLRHNIGDHPRIDCINAALLPEALPEGQKATLRARPTGAWGFTLDEMIFSAPKDAIPCDTIGLEELVARYPKLKTGIIKLDIEGAEAALFERAPGVLDRFDVVFAELHDHIRPGCSTLFEEFSVGRRVQRGDGEKHLSLRMA